MIECVIMASGLSERYGKNKLLEKLGGREVVRHAADAARQAGLDPLAVTRSAAVKKLLDDDHVRCILHDLPRKSDTIHIALNNLCADPEGFLFMPADQPLVLPATLIRMMQMFRGRPDVPVWLGYGDAAGSPVLFPAFFRQDLLAYTGERGGMEVIRQKGMNCRVAEADCAWELWDVDTPEKMQQVRDVFPEYCCAVKAALQVPGRFD